MPQHKDLLLHLAIATSRVFTVLAVLATIYLYIIDRQGWLVWLFGVKSVLLFSLVFLLQYKFLTSNRHSFGDATLHAWDGKLLELDQVNTEPAFILGLSKNKLALSSSVPLRPHLLAIAATGSGKTTSLVLPNVLAHSGSAIVLDVKGEIVEGYAALLARNQRRVLLYDPGQSITTLPAGVEKVNLDLVSGWLGDNQAAISFCENLVEQVFLPEPNSEAAFTEGAKLLGLSVVACLFDQAQNKNQPILEHISTVNEISVKKLNTWLQEFEDISDPALQARVRSGMLFLSEANANFVAAVLPNMRRQLEFFDSPQIRQSLVSPDSYDISKLTKPDCQDMLFITIPAARIQAYQRVLRLIFGTVSALLEQSPPATPANLMVALDEAASLGHTEWLMRSLALHRGYGANYILAYQSLAQIERLYGKTGVREFIANCASIFFGVRDLETAKMLEEMLGNTTTYAQTRQVDLTELNSSERESAVAVMSAQQILQMPADNLITLLANKPAYLLQRIAPLHLKRMIKARA